jgi:multidrug efflux pump subunit AcrA (membrane-fusion protein)
MGSPWRFFRGRTLAKIVGVLLAIVAVIAVLAFVPWKLTIEGRGSLLPEERRITYAPLPATVAEVYHDHGEYVHKGDMLLRLESKELDKELKKLTAEFNKAREQSNFLNQQVQQASASSDLERNQIQAQLAAERITAKSAQAQIEIINEQKEMLKILAPQAGIITTWEVRKNLAGRPVEVGQELISVAATGGDWVLEVEIPDDDMGPVLAAQSRLEADIKAKRKPEGSRLQGYFVTSTDPEHAIPGTSCGSRRRPSSSRPSTWSRSRSASARKS